LLEPDADALELVPVSLLVNSPKNDEPELRGVGDGLDGPAAVVIRAS
jgi:putative SOS response-associated peptidase YedK